MYSNNNSNNNNNHNFAHGSDTGCWQGALRVSHEEYPRRRNATAHMGTHESQDVGCVLLAKVCVARFGLAPAPRSATQSFQCSANEP